MPIFSYLAIPEQGKIDQLIMDLSNLNHCEIVPASNKDIIVLVTDTPDENTERSLQKQLKNLKTLQSLSMTFGHVDEKNKNQQGARI